jgi:hypothetical protein
MVQLDNPMAIYTTLFVASDATLTALFPGWRAARAVPAKVTRKNPFTGDVITVEDWDPGPPAELPLGLTLFDSRGREAIPPVLPPDDEYQSLLENGSPILLRTVPHSAMKGISEVELSALAEAMVGRSEPPARFVDCPEDEGFIGALPTGAIKPLATLDDDQLEQVATRWQDALQDGGDCEDLEWALRRIRALAAEALGSGGHVFSHVLV